MNVFNLPGFESLASCFQSLLIVSAIGSVVVLIAAAFQFATSKWISATWLYFLWFVVLLRFVLFVAPESPTSLLNFLSQPATAISLNDSDAQGVGQDEHFVFSSGTVIPIPIDEQAASFPWSPLNLWMFAATVWLVVVIGSIGRLGLGYLRVKRLISETSRPPGDLEARFRNLKQRLRMRQRTRLRISHQIDVPAMAGLFNPVVILPGWCCRELDNEQLEMVFTHEMIHIQRRDGLIQLVAHLIVVLHWFNPLARIAARFIDSTRELSCDRRVVDIWKKAKLGRTHAGSTAETRLIERKYGRTILDIAGRASSANNASQFSAAFMGGFVGSNQNLIKQRIAMLVSSESQLWLRNIVAAGCIALLLAVGFTSAQTICPPSPAVEVQVGSLLPLLPQEAVPMTPPLGNALPAPLVPADSSATPVRASPSALPAGAKPLPHSSPVVLNVGEVKDLSFDYQIPQLDVRDPAILTARPMAPDRIEFTAVAAGTTEVQVISEERRMQILRFRVIPDVRDLKSKVEKEFPDAAINITGTTDGFVNLFGQVTTEQIAKINEFVVANCSLPVRNQLSDTDPIALKIKVYEVSTTKLKKLGINWSKIDKGLPDNIESLRSLLPGNAAAGNKMGFAKLEEDSFEALVADLEKRDVASLLDQPTLVAQHGRVAEYFSGGEFPMAVINEQGQPTVEFQSFGTKIQTTPYIHSKEEMTLEIVAEVSEVDKQLSAKTGVPGFRVRRVNSGMRVKPGDTIALIGDYRNEKNGDVESTELVFLITPRFIEKGPEFKLAREAAALKEDPRQSNEQR